MALKGQPEIGDRINRDLVRPLEAANRLSIKAHFNADELLDQGNAQLAAVAAVAPGAECNASTA